MSHNSIDAFAFLPCLIFPVFGLIALAGFALWIWMLIDCATNEPSEGNDKVVWILVIALVGPIGALIYFLARRGERKRRFGR
ncbi:MAG: PLDc N-terminal domain-containing protein [Phycisphaerales bacterium]